MRRPGLMRPEMETLYAEVREYIEALEEVARLARQCADFRGAQCYDDSEVVVALREAVHALPPLPERAGKGKV
jgi:hypothetical protein